VGSVEQGSVIAGRYRLERLLARGGMGSVWVARHTQLDAVFAIKFITPDASTSSDARVRFEREAKALAQIKSPNIVQVHDYGIEGDAPFIVMELLNGEDLSSRIKREGRLSLRATAAILLQLSKGLQRAHKAGIVHRDLKPGNIFLARQDDDEDDIVKILDFGIAKHMGSVEEATRTGVLIGSPHYMAPEQVRSSKHVDHRADLWAVGVILFRCITGRLPFIGSEIGDLIVRICVDPLPEPSAVAPDLGPEIDRFFQRALERDPEKRFQSVRDLTMEFLMAAGVRADSGDWLDTRSTRTPGPGPSSSAGDKPTEVSISDRTTAVREATPSGASITAPRSSGPSRDPRALAGAAPALEGPYSGRATPGHRGRRALTAASVAILAIAIFAGGMLFRSSKDAPEAAAGPEISSAASAAAILSASPPALPAAPSAAPTTVATASAVPTPSPTPSPTAKPQAPKPAPKGRTKANPAFL